MPTAILRMNTDPASMNPVSEGMPACVIAEVLVNTAEPRRISAAHACDALSWQLIHMNLIFSAIISVDKG